MKFDFHNPYPTTRLPVFARNVVSTSHPLAAQAGLRMLWKGGNAVDAAIAAAAAMTICEPVQQRPGQRRLRHRVGRQGAAWPQRLRPRAGGLDARLLRAQVRRRRQDAAQARHRLGHRARRRRRLGGAVSDRFGKLPFADLLEPAIEIAERGYLLPVVVQQKWAAATPRAAASLPGFAEPSCRGAGRRGRRAVPVPGGRARPARHRADARARPSTAARSRRRSRSFAQRNGGASRRRTSPPTGRSGSTPIAQRLPRLHPARDPAQRPGHRGADRAGHPGEVRPGAACRSTAPTRSTCRSRR